jgi:hypothetical protein
MILREELSSEIVKECTNFVICAENPSRQLTAITVLNVLKASSCGVLLAPPRETNLLRQQTALGAANLSRVQPIGS